MANLLPGAKFSLPRMSRDNVPELLRSITPQHGVHFLPGLGGSHDSDRTPQTPSILAPSQSIASPPAVAGLRWSASVQSAASTDSGGISLLSALPSINVDLDDDTPIVNIRHAMLPLPLLQPALSSCLFLNRAPCKLAETQSLMSLPGYS